MLDLIKAIVFGIIEGITEWLPISSTGHMIILEEVMPMNVSDAFFEMFEVVIQLGAILAVVVLYFSKLNPFDPAKDAKQKHYTWNLWFKVIVAVLPSAVIGLLLDDLMDRYLYNHMVVALMLILYGVAFMWAEKRNRDMPTQVKTMAALDMKTALMIGAYQCLALVPGTSRSGATILGSILLGVSRGVAAEFSFFLAIPTMVGASALKILKFILEGADAGLREIGLLMVGCAVAFMVSLVVIKSLMEYVRKHDFTLFGIYRIALGILVLIYGVIAVIYK